MLVQAVIGEIGLAAFEPFRERGIIPIAHPVPFPEPMQLPRDAGPELLRVLDGLVVHGPVFLPRGNRRLLLKAFRGRELTGLVQYAFDIAGHAQPRGWGAVRPGRTTGKIPDS